MPSAASRSQSRSRKREQRSAAEIISDNMRELALAAVEREYRAHPELRRFGTRGRARCVEDSEYHLEFLIAALDAGSPAQFVDYCGWAKILLTHRGIAVDHLADNLKHLQSALKKKLTKRDFTLVSGYLQAGLDALPSLPSELPGRIAPGRPFSETANSYLNALLMFDRQRASEIALSASRRGASVKDIYRHIITPASRRLGGSGNSAS